MISTAIISTLLATSHAGDVLGTAADSTAIHNGTPVEYCGWPSTVALLRNGGSLKCTATLVHPRVLLTAAHCVEGGSPPRAAFGEDSDTPERLVDIDDCGSHPSTDLAFCTLEEDVTDVPIIPPLTGCEADQLQEGSEVMLVGYGNEEGIYDPELGEIIEYIGAGPKRQTKQIVTAIDPDDDPGFVILWGDNNDESSGCFGDSGGPTFLRLDDGTWRVLAASGHLYLDSEIPPEPENICMYGTAVAYLTPELEWFESASGYDITPCHDADGTWNPGPGCNAFPEEEDAGAGTWNQGCNDAPLSGLSEICGPPYDGMTTDSDTDTDTDSDSATDTEMDSESDSTTGPDPTDATDTSETSETTDPTTTDPTTTTVEPTTEEPTTTSSGTTSATGTTAGPTTDDPSLGESSTGGTDDSATDSGGLEPPQKGCACAYTNDDDRGFAWLVAAALLGFVRRRPARR